MEQKDDIVIRKTDPDNTLAFWRSFLNKENLPEPYPEIAATSSVVYAHEIDKHTLGESTICMSRLPLKMQHDETYLSHPDNKPHAIAEGHRNKFPYSAIGKIFFVLCLGKRWQVSEGSAFIINTKGRPGLLTAAHCLYSEYHRNIPRQWAQHVLFVPFFNGINNPLSFCLENNLAFAIDEVGVPLKWVNAEVHMPYEVDLGFAHFRMEGSDGLIKQTGALGWLSGEVDGNNSAGAYSLGYPTAPNYEPPTLWQTAVTLSFQNYVTGFPHIRMKGNCLAKGASGGPVIVSDPLNMKGYFAVGLNALVNAHDPDFVFWDSPRLGSLFLKMVNIIEAKD